MGSNGAVVDHRLPDAHTAADVPAPPEPDVRAKVDPLKDLTWFAELGCVNHLIADDAKALRRDVPQPADLVTTPPGSLGSTGAVTQYSS